MALNDEIRLRILDGAREKFLRFGFSRVTMDEIASSAGISKKTLYQHFPGKEQLLRTMIRMLMKEVGAGVRKLIMDSKIDFVEKQKRLMTFMGMHLSRIGLPFVQDLKKYNPGLWKEIEDYRRVKIQENLGRNIREGVEKGVFRRDVDSGLLLLMYLTLIQNMVNPDMVSTLNYTPFEMLDAIFKVMFEGILTDKARAANFGKRIKLERKRGGRL